MDSFETRVAAWLDAIDETDPAEVRRLRDIAVTLPHAPHPSSRWLSSGMAVAVAVATLVAVIVIVASRLVPPLPQPGSIGNAGYPIIRDDPRFARCAGTSGRVIAAFPLAEARDFKVVFPSVGRAPELDVSQPAFVVVFEGRWPGPILPRFNSSDGPMPTLLPGRHAVCVWLGDVTDGDYVVYDNVDTTGMQPSPAP
jgi:hypothetical protein